MSAAHAAATEVRLYDRLFTAENPNVEQEGQPFTALLNPQSLEVLSDCRIEPGIAAAAPGTRVQFERHGYFCVDPDSRPHAPVFNRTVALRDPWAKIERKGQGG